MNMKEIDVDAFVRKFAGPRAMPAKRKKPAAQIMMAPQPVCFGPRLDSGRGGKKRWLTMIDNRPDINSYYRPNIGNY
jgi:hypothetical protein